MHYYTAVLNTRIIVYSQRRSILRLTEQKCDTQRDCVESVFPLVCHSNDRGAVCDRSQRGFVYRRAARNRTQWESLCSSGARYRTTFGMATATFSPRSPFVPPDAKSHPDLHISIKHFSLFANKTIGRECTFERCSSRKKTQSLSNWIGLYNIASSSSFSSVVAREAK